MKLSMSGLARARGIALVGVAMIFAPLLSAQVLPDFPSTHINADRSITFRYRDPGAKAVLCSVENVAKPLAMSKDAEGVWTITSAPLPPGIYRYHFEINGISFLDPANPVISNSLMRPANMVTVPGDGPQLWDATEVPHGTVHHHAGMHNSSVLCLFGKAFYNTFPGQRIANSYHHLIFCRIKFRSPDYGDAIYHRFFIVYIIYHKAGCITNIQSCCGNTIFQAVQYFPAKSAGVLTGESSGTANTHRTRASRCFAYANSASSSTFAPVSITQSCPVIPASSAPVST